MIELAIKKCTVYISTLKVNSFLSFRAAPIDFRLGRQPYNTMPLRSVLQNPGHTAFLAVFPFIGGPVMYLMNVF